MTAVSEAPARAQTRRVALAERFGSLRQWILLAPGLGWLIAFFVVPLVLIFVVSLGHRDELDRVVLSNPSLRQLRTGASTRASSRPCSTRFATRR